ncbi:hypothetical protein FKG94_20005 [Exilibacterium tricleocarpae]|uniref:Uncharacterized protein n=1 Tax=Exilibacterium tricleocarpae TaxID=2591008 RepID=A0A545T1T0_9GAMM|nr:hypothetical protein [Exilibacterium tricleocarpae]TQV71174.1 hypothetical protein FKG94_20005 [Exilibacterium tricleocarpae]
MTLRRSLIFFAAGCLGALANSLAVWFSGDIGFTTMFGVAIAPALSAAWLYPRLVWGGLWGLLFHLPVYRSRWVLRGTVLSLFPTAFQLFVVLPYFRSKGIAGTGLGMLTPAFVLLFNWVWGVATAFVIRVAR